MSVKKNLTLRDVITIGLTALSFILAQERHNELKAELTNLRAAQHLCSTK